MFEGDLVSPHGCPQGEGQLGRPPPPPQEVSFLGYLLWDFEYF